MKVRIAILFIISLTIFLAARSNREQELAELKAVSKALFVPKPFVLCTVNKEIDTSSANIISTYISTKLIELTKDKYDIQSYEFQDYNDYLSYGKELSHLIVELEKKDMEKVAIPQYFIDLTKNTSADLCVFVYELADPKEKSKVVGSIIATVGIGIATGVLTGFSPVFLPNMISSKMHVIVYSKSKNRIMSYEDEEDKDSPMISENTYEQFETLFNDFLDAKIKKK